MWHWLVAPHANQKTKNLELHRVDLDRKSLDIAHKKIAKTNTKLQLHQKSVTQLPFKEGYFDQVFCSLMCHHLTDQDKIITLNEIYRVIKPGGELHFADWGKPSTGWIRARFLIVQLLDGFKTTHASLSHFVSKQMQLTGFSVSETGRVISLVGEIILLKATKPSSN